MNWLPWLGLIGLVIYIYSIKYEEANKEKTIINSDFKTAYQRKYLLTKNEWYEYRKLKEYAAAHDLQICPKVRLLDIIEPRSGKDYRSLMARIQSKHVDFLICDQDLHIKGIVELDDNSHNSADRMQRDAFVDEILTSVGYKVIRTRSITENTLDPITQKHLE